MSRQDSAVLATNGGHNKCSDLIQKTKGCLLSETPLETHTSSAGPRSPHHGHATKLAQSSVSVVGSSPQVVVPGADGDGPPLKSAAKT